MKRATRIPFAGLVVICAVFTLLLSLKAATLIGPIPYLSRTNSPFFAEITNGTMFLETFESGTLSVPGISRDHGRVLGPSSDTDSVDADDGQVDGMGTNGHSFLAYSPMPPRASHLFLFDTNILGHYPTKAGMVLTDGGGGIVTFLAYGSQFELLGTVRAEEDVGGTVGDRFFGVICSNGISFIWLRGFSRSMEVDHLQYGDFDAGAGLVLSTQVADVGVDVCWYARSNVTYQLQYRTNLPAGSWTDLGVAIRGSGSRNCVSVDAQADSQRFYRVVALP